MNWWKFKVLALFFGLYLIAMSAVFAACIWWQLLGDYLGAEECLWDAVLLTLVNLVRLVRGMPLWRLGLLGMGLSFAAWGAYMLKYDRPHRALHAAYVAVMLFWFVRDIFNKHGKKWMTKLQNSALTMVNAASFRREVNEATS
jgi:hypothetical protein